MKLSKNKKGTEEAISDVFAFLIWTLIVLMLFIFFNVSGCQNNQTAKNEITTANAEAITADVMLLNILRTPINDQDGITVADLIVEWAESLQTESVNEEQKVIQETYSNKITKKIEEVMETTDRCYTILISEKETDQQEYIGLQNKITVGKAHFRLSHQTDPRVIAEEGRKQSTIALPTPSKELMYVTLDIECY